MRCNGEYGVNEASAGFGVMSPTIWCTSRFGGHTAYMLLLWCFIRRVAIRWSRGGRGASLFRRFFFATGCVGAITGGFMPTPKALPTTAFWFMLIRRSTACGLNLVNAFKRGEHLALTDLTYTGQAHEHPQQG